MACNLRFIVKNEGVLKVTGSHVHFRNSNVLKMVLDKDNSPQTGSDMPYCHLIAATVMTLGVFKVIHRLQAFFYTDKRVVQSLCHSRASCLMLPRLICVTRRRTQA